MVRMSCGDWAIGIGHFSCRVAGPAFFGPNAVFIYAPLTMKKQDIVATLRRELHAVMQLRQTAMENASTLTAVSALKRFQSARMAATHADLLASSESNSAAQFFLSDLYGATDLTRRDAEIERIVPMM